MITYKTFNIFQVQKLRIQHLFIQLYIVIITFIFIKKRTARSRHKGKNDSFPYVSLL